MVCIFAILILNFCPLNLFSSILGLAFVDIGTGIVVGEPISNLVEEVQAVQVFKKKKGIDLQKK